MIRGLKFTVKGSDKSGHHGHAGRPGSVGGSAPSKLRQLLLSAPGFDDLNEQKQQKYLRAASHIPSTHAEGIDAIKMDKDAIIMLHDQGAGRAGYAVYKDGRREIILDPNSIIDIDKDLAHEFGHHIIRTKMSSSQITRMQTVFQETNALKFYDLEQVYDTGLTRNSFRDQYELFADSYSIWVTAKFNDDAAWYADNLRKTMPTLASFLDSTFEEI